MLGPIRKFSTSIYAKVLLVIMIIPFVFWGMGSQFQGGNKNVVVVIDKEKYSVEDFVNFIQRIKPESEKINKDKINQFLSSFITEKLAAKEVDNFDIKLSDNSLSKLIKHQKNFKRENKFSRIEYEKFLLKNNVTPSLFEKNFSQFQKKEQLIDLIGGGIVPTKYLVNITYDKINQKRNIELINLNDIFKTKKNFSDSEIKLYFEDNKNKYKETFKTIKLIELTPDLLIGNTDFTDNFFKKIDEIDYMTIEGKNVEDIAQELNLKNIQSITLNKKGENINSTIINNIPKKIVDDIFSIITEGETSVFENDNQYFVIESIKEEEIQKTLNSNKVKEDILTSLNNNNKRKFISELVSEINKKRFTKSDFDKLAKDKEIIVKKIIIQNQNDNNSLSEEIVNHIYTFPEKNIIALTDPTLTQSLLVYIDTVENVKIEDNTNEYKKYFDLSKAMITDALYNTYDNYIKAKYEIDINYQALEVVHNYFNQ